MRVLRITGMLLLMSPLLSSGCAGPNAEALAPYKTSVKERPDSVDAHYEYGSAAFALDEFKIARKEFEKTVEMEPDHNLARMKLAQVYAHEGEPFLAREEYKEILEVDDGHREATKGLGDMNMTLIMNFEIAGSIWFFGGDIQLSRIQREMLRVWDLDYDGMMDIYRETLDIWREMVKEEPENADAWCNLGVIANLTNNISGALYSFEQAIKFNKDVLEDSKFFKSVNEATNEGVRWSPLREPPPSS